jgi:hypothetical protein
VNERITIYAPFTIVLFVVGHPSASHQKRTQLKNDCLPENKNSQTFINYHSTIKGSQPLRHTKRKPSYLLAQIVQLLKIQG